jgi:hypothetical protein
MKVESFSECIIQKNILKHLEISTHVHGIYEKSVNKDDIVRAHAQSGCENDQLARVSVRQTIKEITWK